MKITQEDIELHTTIMEVVLDEFDIEALAKAKPCDILRKVKALYSYSDRQMREDTSVYRVRRLGGLSVISILLSQLHQPAHEKIKWNFHILDRFSVQSHSESSENFPFSEVTHETSGKREAVEE